MRTEDEARLTQCCGGDGCGYVNPEDNTRYCVASRCMAWRWEHNATWEDKIERGYCGLAGKGGLR